MRYSGIDRNATVTVGLVAFFAALGLPSMLEAQSAAHHPRPCISLSTLEPTPSWDYRYDGLCPKNHAFFATQSANPSELPQPDVVVSAGTCCPLPAEDMLTEELTSVGGRCPDDFVAIGASRHGDFACEDCVKELHCAKINTTRYKLGPERPAARVGYRSSLSDPSVLVQRGDIPVSLRYAVGRLRRYTWRESSCIGLPFGSVQTAKLSKYCAGRKFRQFLYRGAPGDPPAGTPVRMFPTCSALFGVFSDNPVCVE